MKQQAEELRQASGVDTSMRLRGTLRWDGRAWWVDTREQGPVLLGEDPLVTVQRGRSMRRRASPALHDLSHWLGSGDAVRMTAVLAARMGYRYREAKGLVATDDVVLVRERSPWLLVCASALLVTASSLAYAWPESPALDPTILDGRSIAMRGNDVCELHGDAIQCKLERVGQCHEVHEGRHLIEEACAPESVQRRWLEGAESVFVAFGDFCGLRGQSVECMEHSVRIWLREPPRQVVGTAHMLCARGESNRVSCFDHRGEQLDVQAYARVHATRIASGPHHVCALGNDGVWCWHAHGEPFLATHRTGHGDIAVASSHVCVRHEDAWCIGFDARDHRPWRIPREPTSGLASRGDEVCFVGDDQLNLECSRRGSVPYLDLRSSGCRELALTAGRACVRDWLGDVQCRAID